MRCLHDLPGPYPCILSSQIRYEGFEEHVVGDEVFSKLGEDNLGPKGGNPTAGLDKARKGSVLQGSEEVEGGPAGQQQGAGGQDPPYDPNHVPDPYANPGRKPGPGDLGAVGRENYGSPQSAL